jgi:hypothetical protein
MGNHIAMTMLNKIKRDIEMSPFIIARFTKEASIQCNPDNVDVLMGPSKCLTRAEKNKYGGSGKEINKSN